MEVARKSKFESQKLEYQQASIKSQLNSEFFLFEFKQDELVAFSCLVNWKKDDCSQVSSKSCKGFD